MRRTYPVALTIPAILAMLLVLAQGVFAAESVTVAVSANADDAEEDHLGAVNLGGTGLNLGGFYRFVGLRFANVAVPRGSTVTKAYIEFTANAADSGNVTYTIEAQDSGDAPAFTTAAFNISSRPVYASAVSWNVNFNWVTVGQVHQTADIKDIVQKLLDRTDWASGKAMAFMISQCRDSCTGQEVARRPKSREQGAAAAPKLYIEYVANVSEVSVGASLDDLYQYKSCSTCSYSAIAVYNTNVDLSNPSTATWKNTLAGLRFRNVAVPQGVEITRAYVKFKAYANAPAGTGGKKVSIQAEKYPKPNTFSGNTASADSPYNRKLAAEASGKLTGKIDWTNIPAWTKNSFYETVDLKTIVQELVGQADWNPNDNAMLFFMSGDDYRQVYSYNSTMGGGGTAPMLHIEYSGGGAGSGSPAMMIPTGQASLGRTCTEGQTAQSQYFDLQNNGNGTLNYSVAITYGTGTGWLSLTPSAAAGSLSPGGEQHFTVNFASATLAPGTYEATIKFTDPASNPTFQEVKVVLMVIPFEESKPCDDIPLYAKDSSNPAVLVLLDLSDSMRETIDTIPPGYEFPRTANLEPLVQKLVNRDGWQPGNAMAFFFTRVGAGTIRKPRSFFGFPSSSPLLHIDYTEAGVVKSLEVRVTKDSDDIYMTASGLYFDKTQALEMANGSTNGMALRFEHVDIPKNADVTSAYIQFTPYESASGALTLNIHAEESDNPPTFSAIPNPFTGGTRPRMLPPVVWSVGDWAALITEKKIDIAKNAIKDLMQDSGIAWGFGTWAQFAPYPEHNPATAQTTYTIVDVGCAPNTAEHLLKLHTAIDGTSYQSGSDTPFAPSILGANRYFAGLKTDKDGKLYQPAACRPKVLINITDGRGNIPALPGDANGDGIDDYIKLMSDNLKALLDSGVSAVGIGFGIGPEGDKRAQLQKFAELANAKGKESADDAIYPLHASDANGTGVPYFAKDKAELVEALRTVMSGVKNAVFYGSAPAVTNIPDQGNVVLVTSFNPQGWVGDLEAFRKSNGTWSERLWSAAGKLPEARSLWTLNASNQPVAYTDATLAGDAYLCKDLGDIVNSAPVVVGAPPFYYSYDDYSDFARHWTLSAPRQPMVYVASNDGLLHAIELATGIEQWAFLPKGLHEKLNLAATGETHNPCSSTYCHQSLLDGSPKVADVYAKFGAAASQWRTMLVVGQRMGGTAYNALDITSGKSLDPALPAAERAKFLWEFTDPELGETWAEPEIERVSGPVGAAPVWAAYFSSGYAENDALQAGKEAYLFGIEAENKAALWASGTNRIKIGASATYTLAYHNYNGPVPLVGNKARIWNGTSYICEYTITAANHNLAAKKGTLTFEAPSPPTCFGVNTYFTVTPGANARSDGPAVASGGLLNNALNSPLAVDFDKDHRADRIYVGDLYGNLYRVAGIGKGQSPAAAKLFSFDPAPATPDRNPIRGKASYAYSDNAGEIWVYYGTGRYETEADKAIQDQQYAFGLKDKLTSPPSYKLSDLFVSEAAFTADGKHRYIIPPENQTNPQLKSWALKLKAGSNAPSERILGKPLVVGGIAFFTSFVPGTDACASVGETWVFALDFKTGLAPEKPVFDINGDGKFNDLDKVQVGNNPNTKKVPIGLYIGPGQGSSPVLLRDTLFITTTAAQNQSGGQLSGGLHALLVNIPQLKIRMESWKHD